MIDIHFYQKVYKLKQQLMNGKISDRDYVWKKLEEFREKEPIIYDIESTNACNMRCEMCPRTTMMTRPIETLDMETYRRVVYQLKPWTETQWKNWESFVEKNYGISRDDMSENHFFLYIIPRVITLHGYGEPVLDPHIVERVKLLTEKNIPSYFSTNPANINIKQTIKLFENGLDYLKYSIESTSDQRHKKIRGAASNFTDSYKKILQLLDIKKKKNYKTTIIITMLNLDRPDQLEEWKKLKEKFRGLDVYIYLKSQNQQWYKSNKQQDKSIHWNEFCQFPWSSMTIKSNGEAVKCIMDFNNEIILGDAKKESLYNIWNGDKYRKFRKDHFELPSDIKCIKQCDMILVGELGGWLSQKRSIQ